MGCVNHQTWLVYGIAIPTLQQIPEPIAPMAPMAPMAPIRPSRLLIVGVEGAADVVRHLLKGYRIAVGGQVVQGCQDL